MTGSPLRNTRDRPDAGFTLIELLMTISIMSLLLVTLGLSVTEGFQNTTTTKASIDRSILGNFAARYFAPDVASAAFGDASIVTTNPLACGTGTPIVDIQTSAATAVSYATVTEVGGRISLVRTVCSGTVATALALTSRQHLGTTDSSLTVTPASTCSVPGSTSCSLSLSWNNPSYSISVSGTRWVNSTTTVAP
jgi:prepilin-type N-terminal cleavage/methylation domain-containing protein